MSDRKKRADKRDRLVEAIRLRSHESSAPTSAAPSGNGSVLAQAITDLASEARASVAASERNTHATRWALFWFAAVVAAVQGGALWAMHQNVMHIVEVADYAGVRLVNMERTIGLAMNAVATETEASIAAAEPLESDAPKREQSRGTVRFERDAAREILNRPRRAPPETGSGLAPKPAPTPEPKQRHDHEVVKARMRAQGSALQAQYAVARDAKERAELIDRYGRLKQKAAAIHLKLSDLPADGVKASPTPPPPGKGGDDG